MLPTLNRVTMAYDRREIVRITIDVLRSYSPDEVKYLDRILKRTRIIILGKGTVRKDNYAGTPEFFVPTLFQCRDKRDAEELRSILLDAGWFPSFHWPSEILEMVNHARDQVRREGYDDRDYYVKVRPERRGGKLFIKADVKAKRGGRYSTKGLYACPPIHHFLWDSIPSLYDNLYVTQ